MFPKKVSPAKIDENIIYKWKSMAFCSRGYYSNLPPHCMFTSYVSCYFKIPTAVLYYRTFYTSDQIYDRLSKVFYTGASQARYRMSSSVDFADSDRLFKEALRATISQDRYSNTIPDIWKRCNWASMEIDCIIGYLEKIEQKWHISSRGFFLRQSVTALRIALLG